MINAGDPHEKVIVNSILFSELVGIHQDYFWKNYDKIRDSLSLDSEGFAKFTSYKNRHLDYIGSKGALSNPRYLMRLTNRWLITTVEWEILWHSDVSFSEDFEKLIYSIEDEIVKRLRLPENDSGLIRSQGRLLVHIENPAGLGEDYQKKTDKAIDFIINLTEGRTAIWTESGIREEGEYNWGSRMKEPDKMKSLFSRSVFLYGNNFKPNPFFILEKIGISIILMYEVFRDIIQANLWVKEIDSALQTSRRIFGPNREILSAILRYGEIVEKEYKVNAKHQALTYKNKVESLPHPVLDSENVEKFQEDLEILNGHLRMLFKDVDVEGYADEIVKDLLRWPDFHGRETKWRIQQNNFEQRLAKMEFCVLILLIIGFLLPIIFQDLFVGELVSAIANYLQILTFIAALFILYMKK